MRPATAPTRASRGRTARSAHTRAPSRLRRVVAPCQACDGARPGVLSARETQSAGECTTLAASLSVQPSRDVGSGSRRSRLCARLRASSDDALSLAMPSRSVPVPQAVPRAPHRRSSTNTRCQTCLEQHAVQRSKGSVVRHRPDVGLSYDQTCMVALLQVVHILHSHLHAHPFGRSQQRVQRLCCYLNM